MQEIADDIGWIMLLTTREQKLLAGRSEKQAESRRVKYWITALAVLASLSTSIALADDFKTINGKEYKNVTVSRVEPDGLVLSSKSGISKVYFTELPKEVQERFHYDAAKGDAYSAEQTANQEALYKQRQESERQRVEEREKYWSEHATPAPQQQQSQQQPAPQSPKGSSSGMDGTALDRPASGQSAGPISPQFLASEYTRSEINADELYKG